MREGHEDKGGHGSAGPFRGGEWSGLAGWRWAGLGGQERYSSLGGVCAPWGAGSLSCGQEELNGSRDL